MQTFSPRSVADHVTVSMDMSNLVTTGATVSSYEVAVAQFIGSPVPDPSPSETLDGAAYMTGDIVLQRLTGGVAGCIYVITFTITLSTGDVIEEQALQTVSQYVPR